MAPVVEQPTTVLNSIDLTNEDSDSDAVRYAGYLSDLSDNEDEEWDDEDDDVSGGSDTADSATPSTSLAPSVNFQVRAPSPLKHQRLEVPAREARVKAREAVISQRREAWAAIKKLIASKKDVFEAGRNGLQSY
ncbi:hypothetical protein M422DRAFT_239303 [Sphaerobolus stellatus SS14]|nr:hypothetical protein M422DRAFT_239303 [Sphaerobolus stellatus SS14]